MNHIIHGLWISDIDSVREESTDWFDLVVSVCQDAADDNVGCPYDHFRLADGEYNASKWGGSAEYPIFQAAAERVVAALEDDDIGDVLVHCHVGQNRSAAVCAAAIARYESISFDGALELVEASRPVANPTQQMREHGRTFAGDRKP